MGLLDPNKQPTYEVIKREDMIFAFKAALASLQDAILEQLEELTRLYSSVASSSLWTWNYTSRWDYDMWW